MADYMFVDADNHYYEAEDAFIRHGDQDVKRYVRWVSEGKRRYMVFGSTMIGLANTSVPNPTFNPIATPGAFHARLKELQERSQRRDRHPAQRHAQGVRPARAAPRGLPRQPRAHRHDRRAERGEVPPLPDARRLRRGPHARQRADGVQGVPRVQPVARGGLGLRVPGPPLRAAVHPDARPRPRRRRARVPAEQGRQGGVDPARARPTAVRPPTRRGTGSGR